MLFDSSKICPDISMKMRLLVPAICTVLSSCVILFADEPAVAPKAARSVHLSYITPPATAFYAEVTVEKSTPGSYFEVCGFTGGYFGIQEKEQGKKVGIFSVWDTSKGNDPKAVAEKDRVETLYTGEGVRVSRFGGEGTGGHSDFDFNWRIGKTYRFFITSKIEQTKTEYAAFIFMPDNKTWKHVATFATPNGGKPLTGLYSFIEDFRRDTKSATEVRKASFGNQWIQTADGKWQPVTKARFTASNATWEAAASIDAGVHDKLFFLQTGGDTASSLKLRDVIQRVDPETMPPAVPTDTADPR